MELSITDEMEEQFELSGESTPYLQSLALLERQLALPGRDSQLLGHTHRRALGQFLMSAISEIWGRAARKACSHKVWFESMHMCDFLAARGLDFAGQEATPHAAAVLRILLKADARCSLLPSDSLSALTRVIPYGAAVQPALPQDIDSAESNILRCLEWQIQLPSLYSWLAAFFSRLRALIKPHLTAREESKFEAASRQMWHQSCSFGVAVVMHVASLGPLAPRSLATGLLGLCCVRAGVLPLHDARPAWLGAAGWEQAYAGAMGPAPASEADSRAAKIPQVIQLATSSSMDAVRDACGRVAQVIQDLSRSG